MFMRGAVISISPCNHFQAKYAAMTLLLAKYIVQRQTTGSPTGLLGHDSILLSLSSSSPSQHNHVVITKQNIADKSDRYSCKIYDDRS